MGHRIDSNSIKINPVELQKGSTTDHIEDKSAYLRSQDVTWSGTELSFAADIILDIINTEGGVVTEHTIASANSPLLIADGDSIWVSVDRTQTSETLTVNNTASTAIPPQSSANKDIFVLFRRKITGGVSVLHVPLHKQIFLPGQTARLGNTPTALATEDRPFDVINLGLSTSAAANALTVNIISKSGGTPSPGDVVKVALRNSTLTVGEYTVLSITAANNAVIPSGATLGHRDNTEEFIYIYVLDNVGSAELAFSTLNTHDETEVHNTIILDANSDTRGVLYSTTARSNVPIRLIGKLFSTQTVAGTWAANVTKVSTTRLDQDDDRQAKNIGETLTKKPKEFTFVDPPLIDAPFTEIVTLDEADRQLLDPSKTLKPAIGIERIPVLQVSKLISEKGPVGESVFELKNKDTRVRFVGDWINVGNSVGTRVNSSNINDFIEISFEGTGLNFVGISDASARVYQASIDGGSTKVNSLGFLVKVSPIFLACRSSS